MTKDAKTTSIKKNLEDILDKVSTVTNKLYTSVNKITFSAVLSEASVENLHLFLGYSKNYSDLAKTRLRYSDAVERSTSYDDDD